MNIVCACCSAVRPNVSTVHTSQLRRLGLVLLMMISIFPEVPFAGTLSDSGLVAYYPFNGNAIDESGNGNHGIVNGAMSSQDRFGISSRAFAFANSYIEVPNSPSLQSPVSSVTVAFWTNITQWNQGYAGFFAKSSSNAFGQYGAIAADDPYVQFDVGGQFVRISRYLALNRWYFICLTWDGAKVKLYLNESLYDSAVYTGNVTPDNHPLIIGKHTPGGTNYLTGKLDDIRIYNRALEHEEILRLYNEGSLDLRVIPQGIYDPVSQMARMKDTVRVFLALPNSPHTIVDSAKGMIDSLTLQGHFKTNVEPGLYYVIVKHRNSIETWSSVPVYFESASIEYDFTLFASQAYGNNLILNGNNYCIYSGDVNQDGIVDASDNSRVDNDAGSYTTGYVSTDLTGDMTVDGSDFSITENNASTFVSAVTPNTPQPECKLNCARFINWSGFQWCVVTSNGTRCYPGPNYFSSGNENVFIDSGGRLHLKITKSGGRFFCSAVFTTQTVGYGTYRFYLSKRMNNLDRNVVAGLFTWNDKNCITNANSELDIEFTRWGDAGDTNVLHYSVQPTNYGNEEERFGMFPMSYEGDSTLHIISWSHSLVSFSSFKTQSFPPSQTDLIASWNFGLANPPKSKEECDSSPIIIPDHENGTHLNMNLWLDRGRYPTDKEEVEIILDRVEYVPY